MNWIFIDDFINNTPDAESVLANKQIEVKKDGCYVLLKYGITANFSDPIVQQCRGIIYKKIGDKYECVCRPFDKFFNYQEGNAADIDWDSARIQEKIDGSIVKLWYDEDRWHWSTNGVIHAIGGKVNDFLSFGELILKADNFSDINFYLLDKNYTYMFELVSPYSQIVIQYPNIHLYHIGTRNNITGQEIDIDIGIEKPKLYKPLGHACIEECVEWAEALNPDGIEHEGFVVVDKDYNRIKVKSPKYFMLHHMWNNGALSTKNIIGLIRRGESDTLVSQFPMIAEDILRYRAAVAIYEYKAQKIMNRARAVYEEFDHDRAASAQIINEFDYPNIGYWAIDNEGEVNDYLANIKENQYVKAIEKEVSFI